MKQGIEELEVIQELMGDLIAKMEYGEGDFDERLGREKPKVEVMKMEMGEPEEEMGDDMGEVEEMLGEEEGPDEKFKKRLQSLRG